MSKSNIHISRQKEAAIKDYLIAALLGSGVGGGMGGSIGYLGGNRTWQPTMSPEEKSTLEGRQEEGIDQRTTRHRLEDDLIARQNNYELMDSVLSGSGIGILGGALAGLGAQGIRDLVLRNE
tara:strand:- start:217 stop:582 length:366 start_codon:yes stop_codon:yes gene_type:complete